MKNLSAVEYAALRDDIADNGLIYPVVVDQLGTLIDGFHRRKACKELGIEEQRIAVHVRDGEHRERLALTLNLLRRQVDRDERDQVMRELRRQGMTQEAIAKIVGVTQERVSQVTRDVITGYNIPPDKKGRTTPETRGGRPRNPEPEPPDDEPEEPDDELDDHEPDEEVHRHVWVCRACGVLRDSASRATEGATE